MQRLQQLVYMCLQIKMLGGCVQIRNPGKTLPLVRAQTLHLYL